MPNQYTFAKATIREYLNAKSTVDHVTGCWLWTGAVDKDDYGWAVWRRKTIKAHRLSWAEARGPIPVGLLVCHTCDTPRCINPDHLWLGTNLQNTQDRNRKGRQSKGLAHGVTFSKSPKWIAAVKAAQLHGEKSPAAKLTEDQVRAIRNDTRFQRIIAAEYNVHQMTISDIKRKKSWAHVS